MDAAAGVRSVPFLIDPGDFFAKKNRVMKKYTHTHARVQAMAFVGDALKCSVFVMVIIVIVYMLLSKAIAANAGGGVVGAPPRLLPSNQPSSLQRRAAAAAAPSEPRQSPSPPSASGKEHFYVEEDDHAGREDLRPAYDTPEKKKDELYDFVQSTLKSDAKSSSAPPPPTSTSTITGLSTMSLFGDSFASV